MSEREPSEVERAAILDLARASGGLSMIAEWLRSQSPLQTSNEHRYAEGIHEYIEMIQWAMDVFVASTGFKDKIP